MDKIKQLVKSKKREVIIFCYVRWLFRTGVISGIVLLICSFGYFATKLVPLIILFDTVLGITLLALILLIPFCFIYYKRNDIVIAKLLEENVFKEHQYLLNAIELKKSGTTGELVDAVIEKAEADLKIYKELSLVKLDLRNIVLVVLLVVANIISLLPSNSLRRNLLYPFHYFRSVKLELLSQSGKIALNGKKNLKCKVTPAVDANVKLTVKSSGIHGNNSKVVYKRPNSSGIVSIIVDSVSNSFNYKFSFGRFASKQGYVTVVNPPIMKNLKIIVTPPSYTGVKKFETSGSFAAPMGSYVKLFVQAYSHLSRAALFWNDKDTINLDTSKNIAQKSLVVTRNSEFSISLIDSLGQETTFDRAFSVSAVPDLKPYVHIEKPIVSKLLEPAQIETLFVSASDDYAVKKVCLFYSKKFAMGYLDSVCLYSSTKKGKKNIAVSYIWNLSSLNMYPGDSLGFYFRAEDNKSFGKKNRTYSDTLFFKIPTLREIHEMVMAKEESSEKSVESVLRIQKKVIENIESIMESSRFSNKLSWEQNREIKETTDMLKKSTDSLAIAIDKMKKAVEKLKESGVDKDIISKMDMAAKELDELLKKYGKSIEKLKFDSKISKKALKDRLESLAKELPNLSQKLDNTLKFLKLLKNEARRDMLSKEALKLASKQLDNLAHKKNEKRNRKEDSLLDDVLKLDSDISKELNEYKRITKKELKLRSMDEISKSSSGLKKEALLGEDYSNNSMKKMAESLLSLGDELQNSLIKNRIKNRAEDAELLINTAYSLMKISDWQTNLSERAKSMKASQKSSEENAIIQSVEEIVEALKNLKTISPSGSSAINDKMSLLVKRMNQRMNNLYNSRAAHVAMRENSYDLTALSSQLLGMAQGMSNSNGKPSSGSGGSMGDMLRSLAGQQGAINAATSSILQRLLKGGDTPGNGKEGTEGEKSGSGRGGNSDGMNPNGASTKALKAARDAERRIAEKLKRLESVAQKNGSSEITQKQIGELRKEAEKIAHILSNPTDDIEYRQNRFLSRMLQTAVSMHKQSGKKEKRKSESAITVFSDVNLNSLPTGNVDEDTYYKLRLKALNENIPEKYQSKINKYFDSIGKLYLK